MYIYDIDYLSQPSWFVAKTNYLNVNDFYIRVQQFILIINSITDKILRSVKFVTFFYDLGHFGARYYMDILSDELPEEILLLLDWFEENYIGRVHRNRRRNARFPPNL
uniref:Uncharacterized protein n=1 Tax=Sipha flava TaxID=143950 RepID=A0A2S2QV85_9HEMI